MDRWELNHIFLGIAKLLQGQSGHLLGNLLLRLMLIASNHILQFSFIPILSIRPLFLSPFLITTKTRRPCRDLRVIFLVNLVQTMLGISYIEVLL
jgi:hypothetical protein